MWSKGRFFQLEGDATDVSFHFAEEAEVGVCYDRKVQTKSQPHSE